MSVLKDQEEPREAPRPPIGLRAAAWIRRCFGDGAMARPERAARLLEEAVELAQAEGVEQGLAEKIVSRAWSRPPGEPAQEAGGVGMCFAAWAQAAGVDVAAETEREMARVEALPPSHFLARHAAKIAAGSAAAPGEARPGTPYSEPVRSAAPREAPSDHLTAEQRRHIRNDFARRFREGKVGMVEAAALSAWDSAEADRREAEALLAAAREQGAYWKERHAIEAGEVAAAEARERALREALERVTECEEHRPCGLCRSVVAAALAEEGSPRGR